MKPFTIKEVVLIASAVALSFGVNGKAFGQELKSRGIFINAKALSLEELTSKADRIFAGKVKSIDEIEKEIGDGEKKATIKVRQVTFEVNQAFKGIDDPDAPLMVQQYAAWSTPLKQGDEVMWYLATESKYGLTQPLGIYSGHFRILPVSQDESNEEKVAINLKGNAGLWSPKEPLWSEKSKFARENVINAAHSLELPAAQVNRLMEIGSEGSTEKPLPLDFLFAVTKAAVAPENGCE